MRLDYFKTFLMVAEKKSFTRAAETLFLSQTAVSFQIKTIEEYYGEKLFERLHNSIVLTDAGRILQQHASEIINLEQKTKIALSADKNVVHGECIVGASFAVARTILLRVMDSLSDKFPQIKFHLQVNCCRKIVQGLLDGTVNLGIVESNTINKNLKSYKAFTDRMGLVASPKSPFLIGNDDHVKLENVLKLPLIIGESGCCARLRLESYLNDIGISLEELNVLMTVNSFDELKIGLKQGTAVAIIPVQHLSEEIDRKELKVKEINGLNLPINFVVAFNKHKSLSRACKVILELIKAENV